MSTQPFQSNDNLAPVALKLDRLPILTGSENYRRWAGSWEISFDAMGLLKYLTEEVPVKSETVSVQYSKWEHANKQLRGLLLSAVDEPLQVVVIDSPTAKEAWDQLKSRFDRETANSTISLLKAVTNLSLRDGEDISEFLTTFNNAWNRLRNRSLASTTPLAKAFKDLTSSDDAKGAFLLSSLPESMENVVDNLATKEIISFDGVSAKLMDISANRKTPNVDGKAYSSTKQEVKECSWCKSRKYKYEGHLFTECRKLKAHQQKKKDKKSAAKIAQSSTTAEQETEIFDTAFVADSSTHSSYARWIFDTGASAHMTGCSHDFETLTPLQNHSVKIADNSHVPVTGKGTVRLNLKNRKGEVFSTILQDVLLVPSFKQTRLFSWDAVSRKGYTLFGEGKDIIVKDKTGREVLWAKAGVKAHIIQLEKYNACFSSYNELHQALGHPGVTTVKNPSKLYSLANLPSPPPNFHCPTCEKSKSKHIIPKQTHDNATKPFELIHSDLSGKFSVPSLGKSFYYITFIDDYTRYSWVKFLRNKDEASQHMIDFVRFVQTQFNEKIQRWRTDNGGEFVNQTMSTFFRKKGIVHEKTPPYEHERNGIAERFNQTVTTMARALLTNLGLSLWAEAIATACYLKNR
ncbi:hypothetical protein K3495_g14988, partial [Podosphaera aphanis]